MLDRLTLDQLRVLVTIAELGSFSAAARKLQRVQSAISQTIRALESSLDVTLFDRTKKFPILTPEGAALLADARQLLRDSDSLKAKARSMAQGVEPELALAVDPLFPNDVLIDALREVQGEFPTMPIRLVTSGLGAPERHLRDGSVNLAIYSLETTGAEDVDARFLVEIEMVPVAAPGHPLAQLPGPIRRDALESHVQLILSDANSGAWTRGVVSRNVWRFADLHVRLEFLLAGFGWCNMPRHVVAEHLAQGRLVMLDVAEQKGFGLPVQAVHMRNQALGRGARSLVGALVSRLQDWRFGKNGSG
ncbi:LysR family transcriptional regulator [Xanthobacteraceae bacterium Astr-EGSB]|uniref:LysR family transcriptional regulator n=1 Tax=Astrobacterium formosum TaxID=3069710 RepID=UPI0027AEC0D4|nr:LysR family transcriptional regulator [Xanthobacteraceae bacterium Astr-EGSB]